MRQKNSGFVKPHFRLMVGLLNMLIDLICDYKGQSIGGLVKSTHYIWIFFFLNEFGFSLIFTWLVVILIF
jgi:hypothetical protein